MKYSFACSIALASTVAALPQRAHPRAEAPTVQGINQIFVSQSCSEAEQKMITESFNDAQKLANALNTWVPAGKNQDAMDMYMGTDSSSQGDPAVPGSNYRETIQNNIIREAALYGPPKPEDNRLYIMCNEDLYYPDKTKTKCSENPNYAWTWNSQRPGGIDHYMTYCSYFFESTTLTADLERAQKDKEAIKVMDGFDLSRGATFFHETFHLDKTVGDPFIGDNPEDPTSGVYGPKNTSEWAATRNAAGTMLIAECYTMVGLAIYYRDTLGLADFPKPMGGQTSGIVTRKKLESVVNVQGATDPNDPDSKPSEKDWIPLLGA